MKIALVHELLTMRGGAEKVLKILSDLYPEAPIYTLLYDEKKLGDWFPRERIRVAKPPMRHHLLPAKLKFNHHLYLGKFPAMVESWDFSEFDTVLSTSSAFTHGIITNGAPKHICYVHSPARYLWDRTHDVIRHAPWPARHYLHSTFHALRIWDAEVAARPDVLLAASKEVQRRVELYWRRESTVVYPPIDDFWLEENTIKEEGDPYFLIASTLVRYKRIDLAIEAVNAAGISLKIVGEGPEKNRLQKLAGKNVEFLGFQSQEALQKLYTNAHATLFPGEEDFGLVPLESMACGTPVIAYRSGGALETIIKGETGEFFDMPNPSSLQEILEKFDHKKYSVDTCKKQASLFSEQQFRDAISSFVSSN